VAGVLTFLLVSTLGAGLWPNRAPSWTAGTSLVILPSGDIDRWAAASAAEALSTGQVAATVAEILRSPRIVAAAVDRQGLAASLRPPDVSVEVEVVPGTAVIRVVASATARAIAEATAAAIPEAGATYLQALSSPYRLVTVDPAGQAWRSNRDEGAAVGLLALAAFVAGLTVQQVWYRLPVALAGRDRAAPRPPRTAERGAA
jgi:hypothetical protein